MWQRLIQHFNVFCREPLILLQIKGYLFTTRAVSRRLVVFFLCCFITTSEEEVALAETLFTPETPKVFCGLKHFTPHPSQASGWVDDEWIFIFLWTIPLRWLKNNCSVLGSSTSICCPLIFQIVLTEQIKSPCQYHCNRWFPAVNSHRSQETDFPWE